MEGVVCSVLPRSVPSEDTSPSSPTYSNTRNTNTKSEKQKKKGKGKEGDFHYATATVHFGIIFLKKNALWCYNFCTRNRKKRIMRKDALT